MSEANARDAGTERLLRSALRPPPPGGADACPDAGMLAAFVEGELTATEEAALDAHIAACGRCQETLAVLVPSLPEDVAAGVAEDPVAPRRSRWFTWTTRPRLRWLVPISAAATVAVVFFATRPLVAPDAIAPAAELARADEAARGAAASLEPSKPAMSALADAAAPAEAERDKRMPEPPAQMLAARIAPEEKATTLSATGGDVRWRFGAGGQVARSSDAGRTWQEQESGVTADLLAGSAPSPATCWIVGAAGTVLHTTDGERWARRPFPQVVDLTAVEASSAREATITTRDGQRFETLDGGLTWSRKQARPLSF